MQYSVHLRDRVHLNCCIFLFFIATNLYEMRLKHFCNVYSESHILLISQHGSDCTLLWQYCGIIVNTDNC